MSDIPFVSFEAGETLLVWIQLTIALASGDVFIQVALSHTFVFGCAVTLLRSAAIIEGLVVAV